MSKELVKIEENNLSQAWAKCFIELMQPGVNEIIPLVVNITDLANSKPVEVPEIRIALDKALIEQDEQPCSTVANTIFPYSLWNRNLGKEEARINLFERYERVLPKLKTIDRRNRNGLYFERFIRFSQKNDSTTKINQIEHIIKTWSQGNHRRSALQLAIFDPTKDHTHQKQRGFPCLQQIALAFDGPYLTMTAFYAIQHFFKKAYGNYLGLYHLGEFISSQLDLKFNQLTCVASVAQLGCSKKILRTLEEELSPLVNKLDSN